MNQPLKTKTEIMALIATGKLHESFEHSDQGVFDITAMRERAFANKTPVYEVPIADVLDFIYANRVFEDSRISELEEESWKHDPAMCITLQGERGEEHLLIDGVHRILRRHREGLKDFYCFFVGSADIVRPDPNFWQRGVERGPDWGDEVVDRKIVKRGD